MQHPRAPECSRLRTRTTLLYCPFLARAIRLVGVEPQPSLSSDWPEEQLSVVPSRTGTTVRSTSLPRSSYGQLVTKHSRTGVQAHGRHGGLEMVTVADCACSVAAEVCRTNDDRLQNYYQSRKDQTKVAAAGRLQGCSCKAVPCSCMQCSALQCPKRRTSTKNDHVELLFRFFVQAVVPWQKSSAWRDGTSAQTRF